MNLTEMIQLVLDKPGQIFDAGGQWVNNGTPTEIIVTADNVIIRNICLAGSIRTVGLGRNGEAPELRASSLRSGHTRRAQAAAPSNVLIQNCTIRGVGRIPVYLGPGTTNAKVTSVRFEGHSVSTQVYLDCESAHNTIEACIFNTHSKREAIAVDGSAYNIIQHNIFQRNNKPAICIYRNSGEGGTRRHLKPRYNMIQHNVIHNRKLPWYSASIWLGARQGMKRYSFQDGLWGNWDYADYNTVVANRFVGSGRKVHNWGQGNRVHL